MYRSSVVHDEWTSAFLLKIWCTLTLEWAKSLNFLALSFLGIESRFPRMGIAVGPGGRFALESEMRHSSKTMVRVIHRQSGITQAKYAESDIYLSQWRLRDVETLRPWGLEGTLAYYLSASLHYMCGVRQIPATCSLVFIALRLTASRAHDPRIVPPRRRLSLGHISHTNSNVALCCPFRHFQFRHRIWHDVENHHWVSGAKLPRTPSEINQI